MTARSTIVPSWLLELEIDKTTNGVYELTVFLSTKMFSRKEVPIPTWSSVMIQQENTNVRKAVADLTRFPLYCGILSIHKWQNVLKGILTISKWKMIGEWNFLLVVHFCTSRLG